MSSLPSLVVAKLSLSRSAPPLACPDALNEALKTIPTHPFLALQIRGSHIRFQSITGKRFGEAFVDTVKDRIFLLPVLPYLPAESFSDCYLGIGTASGAPPERTLTFDIPLSFNDERPLYVHTFHEFLVRPFSSGGDPPPSANITDAYKLSAKSLDILANAVGQDCARWNFYAKHYGRWSGGLEPVDSTWSTFSHTRIERRGRSLFGCVYDFIPFNEVDWNMVDSSPMAVGPQLELFLQSVHGLVYIIWNANVQLNADLSTTIVGENYPLSPNGCFALEM